jgi:hypothetical protein
MEHAKLEKGEHKPIGHSSTSAPRKGVRKRAEFARPLRKKASKSKSEKLVCRYCGSNDSAVPDPISSMTITSVLNCRA